MTDFSGYTTNNTDIVDRKSDRRLIFTTKKYIITKEQVLYICSMKHKGEILRERVNIIFQRFSENGSLCR